MQNSTPQKKGMPLWQKLVIGFIVLVVIANIFGSNDSNEVVKTTEAVEITTSKVTQPEEKEEEKVVENWSYNESTDKMTSKVSYFAKAQSTNKVHFEFPYNGGSTFFLTVRKKDGGTDVILSISKGQFVGTLSDDSYVRVKFDEEEPVRYSFNGSSSGSSDLIFLENEKRFISKLKKSKKLMIDAEFYQAGRQVAEFDTEGFVWDH